MINSRIAYEKYVEFTEECFTIMKRDKISFSDISNKFRGKSEKEIAGWFDPHYDMTFVEVILLAEALGIKIEFKVKKK